MTSCGVSCLATELAIAENLGVASFAEERVDEVDGDLGAVGECAAYTYAVVEADVGFEEVASDASVGELLVQEDVVGIVGAAFIVDMGEREAATYLEDILEMGGPGEGEAVEGDGPVAEDASPCTGVGAGVVAHEERADGGGPVSLDGGVVFEAKADIEHEELEIGVELGEHGAEGVGGELRGEAGGEGQAWVAECVAIGEACGDEGLGVVELGVFAPLVRVGEEWANVVVGGYGGGG